LASARLALKESEALAEGTQQALNEALREKVLLLTD
jgi:hypothetical protein